MPDRQIIPFSKPICGEVELPGSRSYTNRALILAALARGESLLRNALFSDDTRHMAQALDRLKIPVRAVPDDCQLRVTGCGGKVPARGATLFVGNAGTCMRFLTALVALGRGVFRIDGEPRMRLRPIGPLVDGLRQLGVRARCLGANDCPPVVVEAAGLPGGACRIDGSLSSQYFSALLMVAPYAEDEVVIASEGELVSRSYLAMTVQAMADFGVSVDWDGAGRFRVPRGQLYHGREYRIEGDASSASYFLGAAAITGGRVRVKGIGQGSRQGDAAFADVLMTMGCRVSREVDAIELTGRRLSGVEVDMNAMPDSAMTLAVVGAFAEGQTVIRNIANWRIKECDRLAVMARELGRLGAKVETGPDWIRVSPGELHGAAIDPANDHRVAMSLTLAGLRIPGVVIQQAECVGKTFPDFFERLESLRPA